MGTITPNAVRAADETTMNTFSPITTAEVVGVLRKAGLVAAIRTTRKRRSGFSVSKVNHRAVLVQYLDWANEENHAEMFDRIIEAVRAAGLTLAHRILDAETAIIGDAAADKARETGALCVLAPRINGDDHA